MHLESTISVYPFGMIMPGRSYDGGSGYRYGFQGQETDDEMLGGAVSFKYRVHDARIGKFLSVDPLASSFPWNSPYAFSENRLIDGFELEGREVVLIHADARGAVFPGTASGAVGLAFDSEGVSAFGTLGGGVAVTDIAGASGGVGGSYYHNVNDSHDLRGWGASVGFTGVNIGGFEFSFDPTSSGDLGLTVGFGVGKLNAAFFEATHTWMTEKITWEEIFEMTSETSINGMSVPEACSEAVCGVINGLDNQISAIDEKISDTYMEMENPDANLGDRALTFIWDVMSNGEYSNNREANYRRKISVLEKRKSVLESTREEAQQLDNTINSYK